MNSKVQTVEGKTKEEVKRLLDLQFKGQYEVVHEGVVRTAWWKVWDKHYAAKILLTSLDKKEEVKQPIRNKPSGKKVSTSKDDGVEINIKSIEPTNLVVNEGTKSKSDNKKEFLLHMLENPAETGEVKEKEVEDSKKAISELANMIENLSSKMEKQKNESEDATSVEFEKMEAFLREQEIESRAARIYVKKAEEELKNVEFLEEKMIHEKVENIIAAKMRTSGPLDDNKERVIALVGPTGVGKTTTLAKIGWELFKKGKTVGFITTDSFRAGAKEQLETYGNLMDAETIQAKGVKELKEALQYFQNANQVDHILIDTVGRNPMDGGSINSVGEYLAVANPTTTALVMSSTSKVVDMKEILSRFNSTKIDSMIFTKLDETYNMGSLLNVFNFTELPLLFITDGQEITKNIYAPTKEKLAKKMLDKEATFDEKILI